MTSMFTEVALSPSAAVWLSRQQGPDRIPADGCVDVIARGDSVWVCGPQTRWLQTTGSDSRGVLGVRLAEGTALALLPVDLAELRDGFVELTDALGSRALPLRDLLLRARDSSEPRTVLAPLVPTTAAATWVLGVRACAAAGLSVIETARELGWSERTLRRRMRSAFGYGYATLVRIQRADLARRLLLQSISPAEVAGRTGYADQPHLNRELVRLTGTTPTQIRASAA